MESFLTEDLHNIKESALFTANHLNVVLQSHKALLFEEIKMQRSLMIKSAACALGTLVATCAIFAGLSVVAGNLLVSYFPSLTLSAAMGIVALGWLLSALIFAAIAFRLFRQISPIPTNTIKSLQETLTCLLKKN